MARVDFEFSHLQYDILKCAIWEVCNVESGSVQFGSEHDPNGPPYEPA